MTRPLLALVLTLVPALAAAQQVSDTTFQLANPHPAFANGTGPQVCIDEGHYNFHTAEGRYKPFANLLRGDGYRVTRFTDAFTRETVAECDLLVIANALAEANETDWSYPHPSAFTQNEIRELQQWVFDGGRLLMFADHAPIAGAARDLAAVFGVVMTDAYTDGGPGPDIFRMSDQTLRPHDIFRGRNDAERVDSVMTFTGQAFQITAGWDPLIVFGPEATAFINMTQAFQNVPAAEWPRFSIAGWIHGAARAWERGRAVFLGEAAMCSAQVAGPNRTPMGMNHPSAPQDAQFCLNVVRWLTGVLDR